MSKVSNLVRRQRISPNLNPHAGDKMGDTVSLGKLLRDARKSKGLTQEKLADIIGVTKGSISQWETGIGPPKRVNVVPLANALGISPNEIERWLIGGLDILDALPGVRQLSVMRWDQLKKLQTPHVRNKTKARQNARIIAQGESTLLVEASTPPDAIAAAVQDESMEPKYEVGDVVIFAPSILPRLTEPFDDVVASIDHEQVVLRRYVPRGKNRHGKQAFDLVSTSPDFETISATSAREIKVLGTVVECRKKRRP